MRGRESRKHSEQGYQAGLISWFAESITINPSVMFSQFVEYETINDNQVKVTISNKGVSGTGIITINNEGVITEFYSDDRQVEIIDGTETRIGWKCEYEDYSEENDILQAHTVRSIKVYSDREVVYFDADDFMIEYK